MPKIFKEISERRKYVHGPKGKIEPLHKKVKNYKPKKVAGQVARVAGLGAIDLSWFLFCLGKYTVKDLNTILLDNKIIDYMQKKHQKLKIQDSDSKFKQFFKKIEKSNPRASATLKLWMLYSLLTLMSIGGVKLVQRDKDDNDNDKQKKTEQIIDEKIQKNTIEHAVTYEEETPKEAIDDEEKTKKINESADNIENVNNTTYEISDANFTSDFLDDNWDDVVISLLEFETWRDKAKLHSGESRYTYGSGLTWVYIKDKNGKLEQHACKGKYINIASNFSVAQKFEQARYHSEFETLPFMKRKLANYGLTEITDQQLLGLFIATYQLPNCLNDHYNKKGEFIGYGIPHGLKLAKSNTQKQVDSFIAGKEVPTTWHAGTNKRRWWCAMIYMGYITTDDLIDLPRDAFTSINVNTILKNGHFVYDAATIEYVLAHAKNPNRTSVRQFINERKVPISGNFVKHQKNRLDNTTVNPSMVKTNEGLKAFQSKDYNRAIVCYKEAISLDVNNMEAYSSLALSYKKLGDQTHSISDYEKVLETVRACNAQMNNNRDLLHDPEVKASTYYNAGLAHEEIAKLQEKDDNIEKAIDSYEKAKQNFKTAYANAKEIDNSERMDIYQEAQNRMDKSIKTLQSKIKSKGFAKGKRNILSKYGNHNSRDTGYSKD